MENQLYFADLNYDALLKAVKTGKVNTEIITRKDGSTFRKINLNLWVNSEPDQFKNDGSIQAQMKPEHREEKHYLGNLRKYTPKAPEEAPAEVFTKEEEDDLPF